MYLLILMNPDKTEGGLWVFTSHYVSINSDARKNLFKALLALHPTMYLLIPGLRIL